MSANTEKSADESSDGEEHHREVPSDCFKSTPDAPSESHLRSLLTTVRFWLVPEYVESNSQFFSFVLTNKEVLDRLIPDFKQDFPFLSKLKLAIEPSESVEIMKNALQEGLLGLIKYLHDTGTPLHAQGFTKFTSLEAQYGHANCETAASNGTTDCLKVCHMTGAPFSRSEVLAAIRNNRLECLAYLLHEGCPVDTEAAVLAATHGYVECLTCLHVHGVAQWSVEVTNAAITKQSISCLQYALENGCPVSADECVRVARFESLDFLALVHAHGAPLTEEIIHMSMRFYRPNLLTYALSHGCPLPADSCVLAVRAHGCEFLRPLHEHGAPLTAEVVRVAIQLKRLACLQNALSQDCPYSADSCVQAASTGFHEGLRCLHEHGAEITAEVVAAAERSGHTQCLNYVNTIMQGENDPMKCASAAAQGNLIELLTLHERGVPWDEHTCLAAIRSNALECLQYAGENGCPMDASLPAEAALCGNLTMLIYLVEELRCPWDGRTMIAAVQAGSRECLEYAMHNNCPFENA